jgi:hypothetical protein
VADRATELELVVKGRRGKMLRGVLQVLVQDYVEERNRLKKKNYGWQGNLAVSIREELNNIRSGHM